MPRRPSGELGAMRGGLWLLALACLLPLASSRWAGGQGAVAAGGGGFPWILLDQGRRGGGAHPPRRRGSRQEGPQDEEEEVNLRMLRMSVPGTPGQVGGLEVTPVSRTTPSSPPCPRPPSPARARRRAASTLTWRPGARWGVGWHRPGVPHLRGRPQGRQPVQLHQVQRALLQRHHLQPGEGGEWWADLSCDPRPS